MPDSPAPAPHGSGTTYDRAVARARALLTEAGIHGPDAVLLLAHVCGLSRNDVQLAIATRAPLALEAARAYDAVLARRARREPLQHITGLAPFRHLELHVGKGVFTPRPETELLVDLAIEALPEGGVVLDAGSGSGAIAVSIATERQDARVIAIEGSAAAHVWTARNVAAFAPRIDLRLGDFATEGDDLRAMLDVFVSNPPYVPIGMVPRDEEVRLHDPEAALYSGDDGLDAIRVLTVRAAALLREGGTLAFEHAEHQGETVRAIMAEAGFTRTRTHQDLTGRDRATTAVRQ